MLSRNVDHAARAAVLEGLYDRPFGTWCRSPRPLDAVRASLDTDQVGRLTAGGWFGESDWLDRVPDRYAPSDWVDALCRVVFDKSGSKAHSLGLWLRENKKDATLGAAVSYLRRRMSLRLRDDEKTHLLEERRGMARSLPLTEAPQSDLTGVDYLVSALLDREDPVGQTLRDSMRRAFAAHYARGRWRTQARPMLRFVDAVEEGCIPKARDLADEAGITRTAFFQRHLVQHLLFFVRTQPAEVRTEVRDALLARGCPYEETQGLFASVLTGWAADHDRDGQKIRRG